MPDSDVWPPKPDVLEPMTEYDDFIEARLPTLSAETLDWAWVVPSPFNLSPVFLSGLRLARRLSPETPVNDRTLLLQVLRREKGLDLPRAQAVVQSYYERHGMALITKETAKALLLPFATLALLVAASAALALSLYLTFQRDVLLRQPSHAASVLVLDHARSLLRTVGETLTASAYGFWLLRFLVMRFRGRH